MKTLAALCFAMLTGLLVQDGSKALEPFQGTWVVTGAPGGIPAGVHAGLVFTGDKYQGVMNGTANETGTFKVDSTTKPTSIDLSIVAGTSAGQKQLGLVEFTGNQMTLALAEPGSSVRPASLSQEPLTLTKLAPIGKELEGSWEGGVANPAGAALRLAIKLANSPQGFGAGTLVSVDQGKREVPITVVAVSGSAVQFIVPAIRGTFAGELKDGALSGTWKQGTGSTPLLLKRAQ